MARKKGGIKARPVRCYLLELRPDDDDALSAVKALLTEAQPPGASPISTAEALRLSLHAFVAYLNERRST